MPVLTTSNGARTHATGSLINQISVLLHERAASNAIVKENNSAYSLCKSIDSGTQDIVKLNSKRSPSPSCSTNDVKRYKEEDDDEKLNDETLEFMMLNNFPNIITEGDVFMYVPGRLSLLTSTNKYKVTIGEIQRRLEHPENLNASILGAILRRAKSKNGGKELRSILERHGIILPPGRRKSTQITLFTSLIEGESEHLARDFASLCKNSFPVEQIARKVAEKKEKENQNVIKRQEELKTARKLIDEFLSVVTEAESETPNTPIDEALNHFQLLTHNFGKSALLTSIQVLTRYIDSQLNLNKAVEEDKQNTSPPSESEQNLKIKNLLSLCYNTI